MSGFVDEIAKLAVKAKKSRRVATAVQLVKDKGGSDRKEKSKMELGKRWREGSPFAQQTDDPRDIAIPYERDGTSAQHMSPEAANSENDR